MPRNCVKPLNKYPSKLRPWSLVMNSGAPKREIQPSKKVLVTVSVLWSGIGNASGHLESRSTTVRWYWHSLEGGRGTDDVAVYVGKPCGWKRKCGQTALCVIGEGIVSDRSANYVCNVSQHFGIYRLHDAMEFHPIIRDAGYLETRLDSQTPKVYVYLPEGRCSESYSGNFSRVIIINFQCRCEEIRRHWGIGEGISGNFKYGNRKRDTVQ
ncbi:hypothetical protein HNY73_019010 [Argiope bruennichi]|uniref:Uncharacterized protein n=1 Tax=Argiope bruennichi TaxID=94029 RepID=A0A8T0EG93_ARGBR|nr:hypothetical protein HNY73_019010 [Argiope bruennichi]